MNTEKGSRRTGILGGTILGFCSVAWFLAWFPEITLTAITFSLLVGAMGFSMGYYITKLFAKSVAWALKGFKE